MSAPPTGCEASHDGSDVESRCSRRATEPQKGAENLAAEPAAGRSDEGVAESAKAVFLGDCARGIATKRTAHDLNKKLGQALSRAIGTPQTIKPALVPAKASAMSVVTSLKACCQAASGKRSTERKIRPA